VDNLPAGMMDHEKHVQHSERDDIYAVWLASLEFYSFNDGVLIATVPVKFLMGWINDHYLDDLLEVCGEEFDNLERVELVQRHPAMRGSP
jgi:chromosomal replication initiation ATPase DnaA